jgi:hypothetical protein
VAKTEDVDEAMEHRNSKRSSSGTTFIPGSPQIANASQQPTRPSAFALGVGKADSLEFLLFDKEVQRAVQRVLVEKAELPRLRSREALKESWKRRTMDE